jgi:hypothetical protein
VREIDLVILHCSDTPNGEEFGFKDIDKWHKRRGFKDSVTGIHCGYHYIITVSGVVEVGRPLGSVGAHCLGHNERSIGVCYIGRDRMNSAQVESFCCLMKDFERDYGPLETKGHHELTRFKTCPNQDMDVIRALVRRL